MCNTRFADILSKSIDTLGPGMRIKNSVRMQELVSGDSLMPYTYLLGSFSVSHHITSPVSEGLFKRGICQSGAALSFTTEHTKQMQLDQLPDVANHFGEDFIFIMNVLWTFSCLNRNKK